jgi:hypothetical protein
MIVNEPSRVIRMTIMGDAPSCGITYDHHSDDSRGVICTLTLIYSTGISHDDYNKNIKILNNTFRVIRMTIVGEL